MRQLELKFEKYDFDGADEKWLLISTTGRTSSARAGPLAAGQKRLNSLEIRTKAQQSGFDRVIFWENVAKWAYEIPQITSEECQIP